MKREVHLILAELHRLLSLSNTDDLLQASRLQCTSANIRAALEALARESADTGLLAEANTTTLLEPKVHHDRDHKHCGPEDVEDLFELICNSSHFATKNDIADFAKQAKLATKIGPKENRRRAARKLARAITTASGDVQARCLEVLLKNPDSQTQGWVDLIRKSR